MTVALIKFSHLVLALGIFGMLVCCMLATFKQHLVTYNNQTLINIELGIVIMMGIGMVTGALLTYPRGFTFHTPWIRAAFELLTVSIVMLGLQILWRRKATISPVRQGLFRFNYVLILVMMILVIHDAITKHTWLH